MDIKKTVIVTAALVAAAVLLNLLLMKLFKQKSTYRAEHSLVGILTLMVMFATLLLSGEVFGTRLVGLFFLSLIPCYLGTVFSDLDIKFLGIGGHRNPIFHSGILFFILLGLAKYLRANLLVTVGVAAFGIGLGSHLLWDMFDRADVRWIPGRTLDRLWLGGHALLCLVLARISLIAKL